MRPVGANGHQKYAGSSMRSGAVSETANIGMCVRYAKANMPAQQSKGNEGRPGEQAPCGGITPWLLGQGDQGHIDSGTIGTVNAVVQLINRILILISSTCFGVSMSTMWGICNCGHVSCGC